MRTLAFLLVLCASWRSAADALSTPPASPIVVPLEHNRSVDGGLFWSEYSDTLTGRFDLDGITCYVSMAGGHSGNGFLSGLLASKEEKAHDEAILVKRLTLSLTQEPAYPVYGPIPRRLQVGNRLFDAALDPAGKTFTLTPTTEQTFPVKLPITPEQIVMKNARDNAFTTAFHPGDTLLLPNGRFHLQDYDLVREGKNKTLWMLTGEGEENPPTVEVAGGPAALKLGEPFVARIEISESQREAVRRGAKEVRAEFAGKGAGGERVTYVTSLKASGTAPWSRSIRPKPPTYKLIKPDGEVVAAGRFEYG